MHVSYLFHPDDSVEGRALLDRLGVDATRLPILVRPSAIHIVSIQSGARDADDKPKLAEAVRGGSTAGLTIVGILIPLSILAIRLRGGTGEAAKTLPSSVLLDFFVGDV
jgi:hypothetical protein